MTSANSKIEEKKKRFYAQKNDNMWSDERITVNNSCANIDKVNKRRESEC